MRGIDFFRAFNLLTIASLLAACQAPDFSKMKPNFSPLKNVPNLLLDLKHGGSEKQNSLAKEQDSESLLSLGEILEGSLANKNQGFDFISVIKYALDTDPEIVSKRRDVEAKLAAVGANEAQKDFNLAATLYGGIEDLTDNTKGVAVALNASRLVFDGGKLDLQIKSRRLSAEAAQLELTASIDRRTKELCTIWLELEKYTTLQSQIDTRLAVLDPLIGQLEQVAKAGIGDVSKVAAAQRTVSAIRVEQTTIAERLALAKLEFSNAFGSVDKEIAYNYDLISNLVPKKIDQEVAFRSPLLLSQYATYQAGVADVLALKAKDGFNIGFEARAMRPFAGSGYDSDESIGLVGRKTLYNGGMLEAEVKEAEAIVKAGAAKVKSTYRQGSRIVQTAAQNIASMDTAILLARENAQLIANEIVYLKQQLIIGGSTLGSVLSAEARLYEAESKEILYHTEKLKAELIIVSSLGFTSTAFGY
jgi:outer membrane protein TolC